MLLVFVLLLNSKSTDTLRFCVSISFAKKRILFHIEFNVVLLKTKNVDRDICIKKYKKISNKNIIRELY